MSYSVYFKYNGKKYKLPVNPESIQKSRSMNTNNYTILGGSEVILPSSVGLYNIKFSFELPSYEHHYLESGRFKAADYYEKMFKKAQQNKSILRFISSNEINEDISMNVLITSLTITEEAGQEGDKQVDIELTEYRQPTKIYKAVEVKKEEKSIESPIQDTQTEQQQVQTGKRTGKRAKKSSTKKKQVVIYKPKTEKDAYVNRNKYAQSEREALEEYSKKYEYINRNKYVQSEGEALKKYAKRNKSVNSALDLMYSDIDVISSVTPTMPSVENKVSPKNAKPINSPLDEIYN